MPIRAITLDLDDTLWPIWPTIVRAEQALHDWLMRHAPRTAKRYPVPAMRRLRDAIASEQPAIIHDFTAQRRLTLARALADSGDDEALVEPAFEVFIEHRNIVDLYPDAAAALARLSARFPVAALTNGNADLSRIGIGKHFVFQLGAREHGVAKPHSSIFHAACERLGLQPGDVLHVGDDPELDVIGAQRAGLRCAWLNRDAGTWQFADAVPDYVVRDLHELAEKLDEITFSP
ncbi:HAD-IA family hydrolase [Xanthomonadaceae bacterium JHOS43]|nr:HAD-IA family hydrolase [Xanthomonadaceae bacterium JHOS43]MCX7564097.1 HAD-IA family hydrolase [Xanthomonadaceae bacterium XH05]